MGQKYLEGLEDVREILNGKKIFLVGTIRTEEYKKLFEELKCVNFMDYSPNPKYEQVCKGIQSFVENQCDIILAIGGGSAIDVAKCIKLFCKMNPKLNYLNQTRIDTKIPLMAIPTTAGTGSESTKHAVIYYQGEKQSISHESIIPNYVVLIPNLLSTLPIYQKKCAMFDALCQAIESWWSVNSTKESKEYSKKAIIDIKNYWKEYIFEGTTESCSKILHGANMAGRAINITATTSAHAMSYKLTSLYQIPHGHAVAICMKEVWKYMLIHQDKINDSRGKKYVIDTFQNISKIIDLEYFKKMMVDLEMEDPISDDPKTDLKCLVESVNMERLNNNPIILSELDLYEIYGRILGI